MNMLTRGFGARIAPALLLALSDIRVNDGSKKERGTPAPIKPREYQAGRNDPCPCGSGKKYKRCCHPCRPRQQPRLLPAIDPTPASPTVEHADADQSSD